MPELFEVKFDAGPRHPVVRIIAAVEVRSIAYADRAIAVHSVQLETFASRGTAPDRFTIVQNVADPRYFPVGAAVDFHRDSDGVLLVYHGTMAPRLGLDLLIQALAKARTEHPELRLLLIGDGDDTPRLQSLIKELSLAEFVTFDPGFISVEELLPRLTRAHIGVVPANVNAFTRNMLPVKLLEYVTLGIPSISTDLPTVRRYFEPDEVTLVPPGDVDAMADAITRLAADPELRRKQALTALRFVERHPWEGERDRYLGLIDELAGGPSTDREEA
jgi:glycosyltransferase involved in cell wall biosynthesis